MAEEKLNALLYFPIPKKQWAVPEILINKLKNNFQNINFVFTDNEDVFIKHLSMADILFCPVFDDEWMKIATNLKWYHSSSIQFTTSSLEKLFNSDVIITNSRGAYQTAVSERAIGSSFYFLHSLTPSKNYIEGSTFTKSLDGLTVGIFGLGENGTAVGLRSNLLGAKVVSIKRTITETPEFAEWVKSPRELLKLTNEADIIIITAPLTSETNELFSDQVLANCKDSSIIINLGRPAIVDEKAMLSALNSSKILGYAVDSLLNAGSGLINHDRILIIPHISPAHKGFWNGSFNIFSDNMDRFSNNQTMRNLFNKEFLY